MPSVSIIIPTRDRPGSLRRCLDSLCRQSAAGSMFEILVVDDGSGAATRRVVEEMRGWRGQQLRYLNQPERGANAARNRGVGEAQGEVVVLVDDDVVAPPDWLRLLLEGLQARSCDAVTGPVRLRLHGSSPVRHEGELAAYLTGVAEPATAWPVGGGVVPVSCNMAVWRRVFDRALFDVSVSPPVEEVDWSLRAGATVAFLPAAWLWHEKGREALRVPALLRLAARRGQERGWWLRARQALPLGQRLRLAGRALLTTGRSFGHAVRQRCWGGALTAVGELSCGLALLGLLDQRRV
ncbi:MAG: glycosyltransferase [Gemmatimonadetes bacterium]|nr:glycosyltransferase [Gemmatimonadota bacterium]